jgi:hypothetical protein
LLLGASHETERAVLDVMMRVQSEMRVEEGGGEGGGGGGEMAVTLFGGLVSVFVKDGSAAVSASASGNVAWGCGTEGLLREGGSEGVSRSRGGWGGGLLGEACVGEGGQERIFVESWDPSEPALHSLLFSRGGGKGGGGQDDGGGLVADSRVGRWGVVLVDGLHFTQRAELIRAFVRHPLVVSLFVSLFVNSQSVSPFSLSLSHTYLSISLYIYMDMLICIGIYIIIYIYTDTYQHIHIEREREREIDR